MDRKNSTGKRWFLALFLTAMIVAGACTGQATPVAAPVEQPEQTELPAATEIPDTAVEETGEPAAVAERPFVRGLDETPLYGGSLVVPRWPDFPTCNPTISTDLTVSGVLGNVFDGLVRHDADLELQPELAESWEMSEDGMTITFYLREDVVWHDGVPFTSADVKFSFDEALSTLHPRGRVVFSAIESIDTPYDFTVIFNMSEPKPAFMYQINTPETMIIPKHIYENEDLVDGPHATCQELPVGTGPFKATEYVPGHLFRVERNDEWYGSSGNYWGVGQPYLDEIIFVFISDGQARVNGLESGEFDYLSLLMFPDNEVARFQAMDGFDVTFEGMNMVGTMNLYGFNMRNEPFDDVCVRQAIAFTMDLEDYNQKVLYGSGSPTMSFLGTSHPEYNPNLEPYPYQPRDVERAEAMLDECGYPRGADGNRFDLRLAYDTRAQRVDMAEIFRQFVEEAGINVIMDASDFNAFVEQVYHDFDYDVMVGSLGLTEPSVGAARLMLSDNIGQANFNNSSAYVNPEVDELWNTYSTSFDPELRRQAIYRIQEIMLEDLPYIWVNFSVYPSAYNSAEFTGFHVDTGRGPVLLRTVWWLNGRPAP